jgi:RNA polymerase sigma factor (sigma-70 family)
MFEVAEWEGAEAPFEETAWSVVLAAGAETDARAQAALAELCRIYWRPIYAYLRRSGRNREDAQDLTQSFFHHLLENETLRRISREGGRFRSFLVGALKLCLADEHARRYTLKRGGGVHFISTDELEAEELHELRADYEVSPDEILDARWVNVILERALTKVRGEFSAAGKAEMFEALSLFLGGEKACISYEQAAETTGVSLGAIKTHIHRLRRQFAAAVRHEIMQTVSAPHEVDDELRHFRHVFARFGH